MFRKFLLGASLLMLLLWAQSSSATSLNAPTCPNGQYSMPQGVVAGDDGYHYELPGASFYLGGVNAPSSYGKNRLTTELCLADTTNAPIPASQPNLDLCPADHPEPYFFLQTHDDESRRRYVRIPQGEYNVQGVLGSTRAFSDAVLICGKADPPPATPVDNHPTYTG